jgi:hypothetical protein
MCGTKNYSEVARFFRCIACNSSNASITSFLLKRVMQVLPLFTQTSNASFEIHQNSNGSATKGGYQEPSPLLLPVVAALVFPNSVHAVVVGQPLLQSALLLPLNGPVDRG